MNLQINRRNIAILSLMIDENGLSVYLFRNNLISKNYVFFRVSCLLEKNMSSTVNCCAI